MTIKLSRLVNNVEQTVLVSEAKAKRMIAKGWRLPVAEKPKETSKRKKEILSRLADD